jgi:hypothetical protein
MVSNLCIQLQKKFIFLWYHVKQIKQIKQNGSKPSHARWFTCESLWYHAKQNDSKPSERVCLALYSLWYHAKQNGSKPYINLHFSILPL